ncbi:MAG: hypothetical protein HY072_08845 [Deltaproteobacteria bacterium]|nr:hypothetical protein [Deltaproteobacteria bacterium]
MKTALFLLVSLLFLSCSLKIYVPDRHTIMEDEAAGEWPDFEKEILDKSKAQGPMAFQKTEINLAKKRLYNILNGELASHAGK